MATYNSALTYNNDHYYRDLAPRVARPSNSAGQLETQALRFQMPTQDTYSCVERTTGIPAFNSFTMCAWCKLSVVRATWCAVFELGAGSMNNIGMFTNTDGVTMMLQAYTGVQGYPTVRLFNVGEWYFVAMSCDGTQAKAYAMAEGETSCVPATTIYGIPTVTATTIHVGNNSWGYEAWNGCIQALKIYNTVLTDAEVFAEKDSYTPVKTSGLIGYYPLTATDLTDHSAYGGQALVPTLPSTISTEAGRTFNSGGGTTGGWTAVPETNQFGTVLSEVSPDDATKIYSGSLLRAATDSITLSLDPISDPGVDTDHSLSFRYHKAVSESLPVNLLVELLQGETVIASKTLTNITATWTTDTINLTTTEAANITNYGDLRVRFTASVA